mmetsp:Transcript_10732/g.23779  ORF Transcript_10732/g.23779 Transcript_10732/m.23779 type:complete len:983 (+) Transcript_10732:105-3053(+)
MGSDERLLVSPSPPKPLPSSLSSRGSIPKPAGLRVRPNAIRNGITRKSKHPSRQLNECYSALLPVLVIACVWCFGCYLYLWISLYQSFNSGIDDSSGGHTIIFNKRKDILAIKLEQFLVGSAPENDTSVNNNAEDGVAEDGGSKNSSLLEQIGNPFIAKQIQSTLISRTGYPNLVLGAYLEPPLPMANVNGDAFMKLRTHTPQNLTYISYPYQHIQTNNNDGTTDNQPKEPTPGACSQKGAQWILPTSHPKSLDHYFESNVFKKHNNFDKRWELALGIQTDSDNPLIKGKGHCPVDADPYLPWIHDVFPSNDGSHVDFIISNKRRCNTDPNAFESDLKNLEPQVALMQPIPVKRMKEDARFAGVLGKLWSPTSNGKQEINGSESLLLDDTYNPPRYILATSLDDADEDGKFTRFICRFHTLIIDDGGDETSDEPRLKTVVLGETFSKYPYNPEHANYRKKGSKPMLTSLEKGHDEQIWNSVYSARCPVPHFSDDEKNTSNDLINIIASGKSVFHGTPLLYLDLIPIRTPVRTTRDGFGLPGVTHSSPGEPPLFDPKVAWGNAHVLPRVEASGRWTNIPICLPPTVDDGLSVDSAEQANSKEPKAVTDTSPGSAQNKTNFLVACVWASHSFSTRGQTADEDSSTSARLREFLAYHTQVAGFDHVYVYDNSDTSANNDTLAAVTDLFSPYLVTRIPWHHRVCNNNRPMHANPGERSSQYAAENSCRARYGPDTTWMASLDVDEYLIPTGKQWKNLRHWLEHVTRHEDSTKILSFYQTRSLPNVDSMVPYEGSSTACKVESNVNASKSMCLMKDPHKTFMETYNCEPTIHPKPQSWAWRAKKQIYCPDFVMNHFVHYSIVTRRILDKPLETSPRFAERAPFERRVNELTEGFLLHTKTTGPEMTSKWHEKCSRKGIGTTQTSSCKVGIPSSEILLGEENTNVLARGEGDGHSIAFESNCYRHSIVMNEWVPKLEAALSLDNPIYK